MGQRITRTTFDAEDYARFHRRLAECLTTLGQLLERPGFGVGATTVGAELELFLVDKRGRPLFQNDAVRAAVNDPRISFEIDRFNLEVNASPTAIHGHPFSVLGAELNLLLDRVGAAAARQGGRSALIGILPTLRESDLVDEAMSAAQRYHALNAGLRRMRAGDPFRIDVVGADHLQLASDGMALEGANTSFQVHLRVNPADFVRTFNAVQLATAPALAVACNSPTFLGHRLWDETRVALIKQSTDDRDGREPRRRIARVAFGTGWLRGGPLDLFAESVRSHEPLLPVLDNRHLSAAALESHAPSLAELRLHQGTVWRWNRAIYDPAGGGHLRIEMRALPAGPTVLDMLANAALLVGLSLSLANRDPDWTYQLSFERAEHNFLEAARHGLAAELSWPLERSGGVTTLPVDELVSELLPGARDGLVHAGVASDEADHLLDVIASRVATKQTGATWQRSTLAAVEPVLGRDAGITAMFEQYLEYAASEEPVHTWPAPRR
jgi:gamma-glutamyl:cysteine ligase YbdK (ATP-grasp superfamily)